MKPFFEDPALVRRLASSFIPDDERLHQDILHLANRFMNGTDSDYAWHHLVLAVGNFKRQGGTVIQTFLPALDAGRNDVSTSRPVSVKAIGSNGDEFELSRDERSSWEELDVMRGLSVATTSTLLAALWPESHIIIDVRVLRTSIALSIANDDDPMLSGGIDSLKTPPLDWNRYDWYRSRVLATAESLGARALDVERAIFLLDRKTPNDPERTWSELASAVSEHLV